MEIFTTNKKTKKALITFSGLDGSGKSTFVNRLKSEKSDFKVIHIVNFRLINKVFKSSKSEKKIKNYNSQVFLIGLVNLILMFFDILIFRLYFFISNKSFICDRYFYDLLAVHEYKYGHSFMINFIKFFIKKPSFPFYIDVNYKQAQKREVGDDHDEFYFKCTKKNYDRMINDGIFYVIKNLEVEKSFLDILKKINAK